MEMKMIGKKSNQEEEDRISRLSDDVLSHIVSFLETREAVRSSVLSKRWEKVWTWIHRIHLHNKSCSHQYKYLSQEQVNKRRKNFDDFVDGFLSGGNFSVTSFCLRYSIMPPPPPNRNIIPCVIQWIDTAISRYPNLQNFDFHFDYGYGVRLLRTTPTPLNMPPHLFECQKLVVLKLNSAATLVIHEKIYLDVPETVSLPSLKELHLTKVVFKDEISLKNLLLGCPVLEHLCIRHVCNNKLFICSHSLKKLIVGNLLSFDDQFGVSYVVETPKLEYLYFGECRLSGFSMTTASPSLISAEIDICTCTQGLFELFQGISEVQNLKLSGDITIMLDQKANFPEFHNLIRLLLRRSNNIRDIISCFLQRAPHLKHLIMFMAQGLASKAFLWSPPELVPECLTLHLETISIVGYWSDEDQVSNMIEYLLDKGKVLKKMAIFFIIRKEL